MSCRLLMGCGNHQKHMIMKRRNLRPGGFMIPHDVYYKHTSSSSSSLFVVRTSLSQAFAQPVDTAAAAKDADSQCFDSKHKITLLSF